jgi:hypothetical protein
MWRILRRFLARRRYGFSLKEHRFSRMVPVAILAGALLEYYGQRTPSLLMLGISIVIWICYWIAHSLEKIAFRAGRKDR